MNTSTITTTTTETNATTTTTTAGQSKSMDIFVIVAAVLVSTKESSRMGTGCFENMKWNQLYKWILGNMVFKTIAIFFLEKLWEIWRILRYVWHEIFQSNFHWLSSETLWKWKPLRPLYMKGTAQSLWPLFNSSEVLL